MDTVYRLFVARQGRRSHRVLHIGEAWRPAAKRYFLSRHGVALCSVQTDMLPEEGEPESATCKACLDRYAALTDPEICPGSARLWGSGTGSPICPACYRGPISLKVRRPVRRYGHWTGHVPMHQRRTS